MNCKKMMTSLTAAALCVSLAACGSTGAASGAAASSESTAAESAATSEAAPAESAAETIGSGKVTVYMPSPAGLADKLAEGYTAKTGIVGSLRGKNKRFSAKSTSSLSSIINIFPFAFIILSSIYLVYDCLCGYR